MLFDVLGIQHLKTPLCIASRGGGVGGDDIGIVAGGTGGYTDA